MMTKLIAEFTISLDGFIAGPDDDVRPIFGWYTSGDTDFQVLGSGMVFKVSRASAELLRREWDRIGAIVTGRRDFDVSNAWGGSSPLGVPIFIVTHTIPQEWDREDTPFTFVTDLGSLDVLGTPSGTAGYPDLALRAQELPVATDLRVPVVVLGDLMRMKRASGRTKDRLQLEVLSALDDETPTR